jgi:antibiotic biosynthesis monooxygenase (ABM) superfamily enzyme
LSYLPFPKTAADRENSGDPRKSVAERYADREDYMTRYRNAVEELVKQRWILSEDREALLNRGEREWVEATK